MPMAVRLTVLAALACLAVAVTTTQQRSPAWTPKVEAVPSPAAAGSGGPQLTVSHKGVLLSWIERADATATLKFSERTSSGWTKARVVASGTDWFVNWADVPSVLRLADGTLVAHWLQKSGPGTYAYDVRLSYSSDDGKTWAASFRPHSDGTLTEHGFASLVQIPGAGLGLVWLDGRAMAPGGHAGHGGGGAMSLRFGAFDRRWKQTAELPVDLRVCECCPTAAAVTSEGLIAVFRGRSGDEVRDIQVARLVNGTWSSPKPVHRDNWRIQACPVNGPAVSARGPDVAVAWFTGEADAPRAYLAFSTNAGRSFGSPLRLDAGTALGRVGVALLPDGSAVAAYLEHVEQRAELRIRRVERGGTASDPLTVAGLDSGRSSGYPRIAVHGQELVIAWVERGSGVRTAFARIP